MNARKVAVDPFALYQHDEPWRVHFATESVACANLESALRTVLAAAKWTVTECALTTWEPSGSGRRGEGELRIYGSREARDADFRRERGVLVTSRAF